MECPFCRISSMRSVVAGEREIDRCLACGALWFDHGEIRELTDGRRLAAEAAEDSAKEMKQRMERDLGPASGPAGKPRAAAQKQNILVSAEPEDGRE